MPLAHAERAERPAYGASWLRSFDCRTSGPRSSSLRISENSASPRFSSGRPLRAPLSAAQISSIPPKPDSLNSWRVLQKRPALTARRRKIARARTEKVLAQTVKPQTCAPTPTYT